MQHKRYIGIKNRKYDAITKLMTSVTLVTKMKVKTA